MLSVREINELLFADKIDLVQKEIETLDNKLLKKFFLSKIAYITGDFDTQFQLCREILAEDQADLLTRLLTLDCVCWFHIRKGEYALAYDFSMLLFDLFKENKELICSQFPEMEGNIYNILGSIALEKGRLDDALNHFKHSLKVHTEIEYLVGIVSVENNLAYALQKKGNLRDALKIYNNALEHYETLNTYGSFCIVKSNVGEIYRFLTNFSKALEHHQEVLEYRIKKDNLYHQAVAYYYLGITQFDMGDLKSSKVSLDSSVTLWRKVGNSLWLSASLFVLGKIKIELNENLTPILEELDQSNKIEYNGLIYQRYILLQSIYYLAGRRMQTVALAQRLLIELLDMDMRDFEITYEASLVYTQLLLVELRMTNDMAIYEKIKSQINFMQDLAKGNLAYGRIIDILFLRAKLSIADSNYISAEKYIYQAQITAEEYDLENYLNIAENVQNEIRQDILRFQSIIDQNRNLFDKLEILKVKDYLTMVHRVKEDLDE